MRQIKHKTMQHKLDCLSFECPPYGEVRVATHGNKVHLTGRFYEQEFRVQMTAGEFICTIAACAKYHAEKQPEDQL